MTTLNPNAAEFTPAAPVARVVPNETVDYYKQFTVTRLKEMARYVVKGFSTMKREELVQGLIRDAVIKREWHEQREQREQALEERKRREEEAELEHKATRCLEFRQQASPYVPALKYPFSFITSGEYPRVTRPIPGQPDEPIGKFPSNIEHYYWIHEGVNDEEPWMCLCKLDNDVYVFYKGECDYTGFDCQGNMQIYASREPSVLLQMAMTTNEYNKYVAETQ